MSVRDLGLVINLMTTVIVILNVIAVFHFRRARYRAGWLDGRLDLLVHMERAQREGLDFETFIRQVTARDGFLIPGDL